MARRKAPPHLDHISGAELRRREERPRAVPVPSAAMVYKPAAVALGPTRDDFEDRPPGTAVCVNCGARVIWSVSDRPGDHARNRDGTPHHPVCDAWRSLLMSPVAPPTGPLITIQSGPRNARTDPSSGLRFYTWQGQEFPSVTTIRRMAGLPHGLHQWAIGQVATYAVGHASEIADRISAAEDPTAVAAVIKAELRKIATAERDKAATLGTAVHDAAATGLEPDAVAAELRPRLRQYHDWLRASGAEVLGTEFQCWHLTVGYAGTADLLVRLRDGSIWLVDLKTGKGVYGEYSLQLIAYLMAEFVGSDNVIDEKLTGYLQRATGMAVLHLADTGWEFVGMRPDSATWEAFRGLLTFATWMRGHEKAADVTTASRKGKAA